jgi:hypothetical protein
VSVQPPAAQSIEHVPPLHVVVQLPPVHDAVVHDVVLLQFWMQSPPVQSVVVHVPPSHVCMQSPLVQPPMLQFAFVQF